MKRLLLFIACSLLLHLIVGFASWSDSEEITEPAELEISQGRSALAISVVPPQPPLEVLEPESEPEPEPLLPSPDESPVVPQQSEPVPVEAVFGDAGVFSPASIMGQGMPAYPNMSRRRGEEGKCTIEYMVNEEGRMTELVITRSSGFSRLDNAVREWAQTARFRPAMQGDKPVRSKGNRVIVFELNRRKHR